MKKIFMWIGIISAIVTLIAIADYNEIIVIGSSKSYTKLNNNGSHAITVTGDNKGTTAANYEEYNVEGAARKERVIVKPMEIPKPSGTSRSTRSAPKPATSIAPVNQWNQSFEDFMSQHSSWADSWRVRPIKGKKREILNKFFTLAWSHNAEFSWEVLNDIRTEINGHPPADLPGVANRKYTNGSNGEDPYIEGTSFRQVGVSDDGTTPLYKRNKGPSLKDQVEAARAAANQRVRGG